MLLFDSTWIGAALRVLLALTLVFGIAVYLTIWAERRVSAFIQDRLGPNRVGPLGLFQGLADMIKLLFKEELRPAGSHLLYLLAPMLALFPALLVLGAIPFGARRIEGDLIPLVVANVDVGILYVLAVASLSVFAILVAGWSSRSKYPMLGALRAGAQLVSYEVPLSLSIMTVLLLTGSAKLSDVVLVQQSSAWFFLLAPIACLVFIVSMFAETNRLPFDMPEGESEIIGYHAEYSSMKFAIYFMAEYANMVTASALMVLLFFGGWEFLPFFGWDQLGALWEIDLYAHPILWVLPTAWFGLKIGGFLFLFIWIRWTIPRFRYDQLMRLGWKRLVPISAVSLVLTTLLLAWGM